MYGGRSYIGHVPAVLVPTATPAADVLLPGDPGRALALAQELLVAPKMSNHAHGDGVPAALRERWLAGGAVAAEMQTAALFAAGARLGVSVAALLVVTGGADGREGDSAALEEAASAAGALAARALGYGGAG